MKYSFNDYKTPLLTVMIKQTENPENAIAEIGRANYCGAEAFGIQLENLPREFHTPDNIKNIFSAMGDKPIYVTNYKLVNNIDISYEEIGEELLSFLDYGATLLDVMGDMFCKAEDELTMNEEAISKQIELINRIHKKGGQVIMSSHVNKFMTEEQVLKIANEHKRRGADISKIVAYGNTMEEQIENLRITSALKEKLGIPYLFLSGGESLIHRRLGILLGCCMSLCVCELSEGSDNPQPLIYEQRKIRDELHLLKL